MPRLPSLLPLEGRVSIWTYAVAAPLLILSQHLVVALAFRSEGARLLADERFWLMPMSRLAVLPDLSPRDAVVAFIFSLAIAWLLALLSFRRASRSNIGYALAALTIVPFVQLAAVALLALMPIRPMPRPDETERANVAHILQGVLAGVAIIIFAVLVSAVTFGAYGWGLFVMTPFLVGLTTGYLANRETLLESGKTAGLVLAAAALGSLSLVMLALEGLVCILLASPLGAVVALLGGWLGRAAARAGHRRGRPLLGVALLPAVFALEAAMPPAAAIDLSRSIDIEAPAAAVWEALVSDDPIASSPGLVGRAGLAFPIRGRLLGEGVGAGRIGFFSTGIARERITEWLPGRRLAFAVVDQPPAMEEMSPWRRVHAPHVHGYFDTGETRFHLAPLPDGGTRLTISASHMLRLDPVLYWEPFARWAIGSNTARVLADLKSRAEIRRAD